MSNDIVITKELAKDYETYLNCELEETDGTQNEMVIHHRERVKERLAALRAAPEAVSLEGVERMKLYQWLNSQEDGETELARISDLRRLVAPVQPSAVDIPCEQYTIPGLDGTVWKCGSKPASAKGKIILCDDCFGKLELWGNQKSSVQPSAVVSREAVDLGDWSEIIEANGTDENGRNIRESWVRKVEADEAIYQLSLQLPQPVAPIQSGGVDHPESALANILSLTEMNTEYKQGGMAQVREWIVWRFKDHLSHLTTTQSAPSVGSVPTVGLSELVEKWRNERAKHHELSQAHYVIASFLADITFLTSRTEGK